MTRGVVWRAYCRYVSAPIELNDVFPVLSADRRTSRSSSCANGSKVSSLLTHTLLKGVHLIYLRVCCGSDHFSVRQSDRVGATRPDP